MSHRQVLRRSRLRGANDCSDKGFPHGTAPMARRVGLDQIVKARVAGKKRRFHRKCLLSLEQSIQTHERMQAIGVQARWLKARSILPSDLTK